MAHGSWSIPFPPPIHNVIRRNQYQKAKIGKERCLIITRSLRLVFSFVLPARWLWLFSPCCLYTRRPPSPLPIARRSRLAHNAQRPETPFDASRRGAYTPPHLALALVKVKTKASMPSFESQSSSTSGSHSTSISTSCSSSSLSHSHSRSAGGIDDDDTLKLKTPRTYTHSVGFPRYEDLFYRPPPRTSSRAYLGLGLGRQRRNRDARVLVPPPASHIHKYGCDYDCGLGYGNGKDYEDADYDYDCAYDYEYARYDPRASPGVDEQLRALMYEMRDWVVENPEEAYKRLQVCLRGVSSFTPLNSSTRRFL